MAAATVFLSAHPACAVESKPNVPTQQLMKLVFPDIDDKGKAHKSVQIRQINKEYDPSPISGDVSVNAGKSEFVNNNGRKDFLLELDVDHHDDTSPNPFGGEILLALYELSPKPRLLDVLDVRADREGGLWDKPSMLHAGKYDSPIYYFAHLNAGEDHYGIEILEIVHNKLVESEVGLPLSFSARGENTQIVETPSLKMVPNSNPPAYTFSMKVVGKHLVPDSDKVKDQQTRLFTARLTASGGRWQCNACGRVGKQIAAMENKFGFDN
jgi:hypothetical protein